MNNGHVKLEKVGEAVPAYNLCVEMKTEEVQCAKIERLMNNAVKLNGSTDPDPVVHAVTVNHNNVTSKQNGDDHKLVNGYGHDDLDKDHERNGITSPNRKRLLNGKIQSKSIDIIDKLNDEINATKIKRKIQNDLVVSDELKSPKKKTKKINEMNLAPITTSTLSVVLNKPSHVSTTNNEHHNTNGIVVQQQLVQPQQNPPITNNLHVNGVSNNQQSAQNTTFVNNNLAANAHIVPFNQSHSQPIYIKFDYMCEWNNCKM